MSEVNKASGESWVYTACPGWGDHDYCAIKTVVKDGKIIRTERAEYPNKKLGCDAHICQKGLRSAKQVYAPDRLLYPQKRVGKRGEGKFERISWDQALDEISEKFLQIKNEYGPESVAFWNLVASVPPSIGLETLLASRFMSLWGATDPLQSIGLDNGPFYAGEFTFNNMFGSMTVDPRTFQYSDYIIVWGANPLENQMRTASNLAKAKDKGAKLVDIGLIFDVTAGFSDWFVPVIPGSDPYLALAMANYIVEYGLYDKEYLLENTVAAYLVEVGSGQLARDDEGSYLVWDAKTNAPYPVAPAKGSYGDADPQFEGIYMLNGKQVRPVFAMLKAHLSTYTLKSAEKITGVPAENIAKLSEEYAAAENAYIIGALGLRYANQGESYRAMYLLGSLTGNIGHVGGGVTTNLGQSTVPCALNMGEVTRPLGEENNKMRYIRNADFFDQVVTGDPYPIKALFVSSGNPVHCYADRNRWMKAFESLELIVDYDVWITDTGLWADYLLPDCMPFERYDIIDPVGYGHIVLQEPAIEPLGEVKDPTYLYHQLAKRVGLEEYFYDDVDEYLRILLKPIMFTTELIDPPLTLERLKAEKAIPLAWNEDAEPFDQLAGLQISTPTGRIEFYDERLSSVGFAFPTYSPPVESPIVRGDKEYPYEFFTGRQRFFMQSMFSNDPLMRKLVGEEPFARMNPIDAKREGILDGEKVEVYNKRGSVIVRMRVDEAIPPQTIQVLFGWRHGEYDKGTYSDLLFPAGSAEIHNEVGDLFFDIAKSKYGESDLVAGIATPFAAGYDTTWDCACNVRKLADQKEA